MTDAHILVNGEVVLAVRSGLQASAEVVPCGEDVSHVEGERTQHATRNFYVEMEASARAIGGLADRVRSAVEQHADGLQRAVELLGDAEGDADARSRRLQALIAETRRSVVASQQAAADAQADAGSQTASGESRHL